MMKVDVENIFKVGDRWWLTLVTKQEPQFDIGDTLRLKVKDQTPVEEPTPELVTSDQLDGLRSSLEDELNGMRSVLGEFEERLSNSSRATFQHGLKLDTEVEDNVLRFAEVLRNFKLMEKHVLDLEAEVKKLKQKKSDIKIDIDTEKMDEALRRQRSAIEAVQKEHSQWPVPGVDPVWGNGYRDFRTISINQGVNDVRDTATHVPAVNGGQPA